MSKRCCLVLLAWLTTGEVWAMPPAAAESDRAVARGQVALRLYESGAWTAAYDEFAAAEALAHSPVFLLFMARSLRNNGQWVASRQLFTRLLREELPAGAPAPWLAAVENGRAELGALESRIPRILLRVPPGLTGAVRVLLDARPLSQAELSGPINVDPGTHLAVLEGLAGTRVKEEVNVQAGQRDTVVQLAMPGKRPPPGPSAVAEPAPPSLRTHRSSQAPAAYAALGLGVVALGVGAVTGWMALQSANEVKKNCVAAHCLPSDEDKAATASDLGRVSTIGFAVGGVSLATGVSLLLVAPRRDWSPSSPTAAPQLGIVGAGRF
jgi:hypothetical protein